jgi:diguanylate cyclase (GGDEF)-like protein/PAS domain S-box-containing protein
MNTSLSARIAGYFGTLFLAAMVSMFALWYFGLPAIGLTGAGHMQLAEVTRALEHEADHRRTMITQAISERRGDALVLAENRVVSKQLVDHDPHLAMDFERVTSRLQRAYPDRYQDVLIVDPTSAAVLSSTRQEAIGHPFQDTALIARARAPGIRELVEQVDSPQGTTVAIVRQMFAPTDDGYPDRRLVGILITLISPRMLFPDFAQVDEAEGAAAGTTFLFDSRGEPLAQSVGGVALNPPKQVHTQVVNGFEGTLQGHDAMGKPTIQVVRHVRLSGNVGWALVHQIGQEEALAKLKGSINTLVVVGLLLTVLALVVFTLAAYRLTLPLRALARTARQVGKGDLSARAPLSAHETREITTLAQAFNDMADNVEQGHLSLESSVQARTLELAGERDRAQGYLDIVGVMLLALDLHGRITMVNAAGTKLLGHHEDLLIGLDWFDHFIPAPKREPMRQVFHAIVSEEIPADKYYEIDIVNALGAVHTLSLRNTLLKDSQDRPVGTLTSAEDITERKAAEAALRVAAIAFESQQGMYVADANWAILRVNRAFTAMLGYSAEEALGQLPAALFGSDRTDRATYDGLTGGLQRDGTWEGEVWDRRKDGSIFPVWLTISAVTGDDGLLTHYVVSLTDITERKATEDEIRNLAFYDPLTGLPNRRLLMDRLGHAMAGATRHRKLGALLFVDLDHFKTLNDTLGHDKGDLLLEQVATRLRSCTRNVDTVARLGGDEFVVLLEDLSDNALDAAIQAEAVGEKIVAALNQPYEIAGYILHSSPSIGITVLGECVEAIEEPLKRADVAMYQAKAAGRNTLRFFDPQTQIAVAVRAELEAALREAVQARQFVLHYQAQVLSTGHVVGAEALLRWPHPQHGMVSPATFIPLAEETGVILPLGRWVLETACTQLQRWATEPHLAHLTLSVNVSAREFLDPNFVANVLHVLQSTGANPLRLKLELTESLLVSNVEDVIAKMSALKNIGIGFSLDDFGTGYSSLSYLKRLPLDQLKIDQGFVRDILDDPNDVAIAKMVVALADSMGLNVIAEGVETQAQRDLLAQLGCLSYQGYLFSKPLPLKDFEVFVRLH